MCFVNSPMVNILDNLTDLWLERQHLHMVCLESTYSWVRDADNFITNFIRTMWPKWAVVDQAVLSVLTPPSVSVWRPAPPSWPWGWCPSVYSFTRPCGRKPAASKSRMIALVSSRLPLRLKETDRWRLGDVNWMTCFHVFALRYHPCGPSYSDCSGNTCETSVA